MCGDNLRLEPLKGELKPGSHCNIKMTLVPSRFPTHFEGEIQCSIDWERDSNDKMETRSVQTTTALPECAEYLFIRLKKRSKINKVQLGHDVREGENLMENILHEALHDILESDDFDNMLDTCHDAHTGIYASAVSNQARPAKELMKQQKPAEDDEENDEVEDFDEAVYESI